MKKTVLFLCTHNSARSQIAEGLVNMIFNHQWTAYSAGTQKTTVNPLAIKVLAEIGINISHHTSKSLDAFKGQVFDLAVTVCDNAKETCPYFPGEKVIHLSFKDPTEVQGTNMDKLAAFRRTRDEIEKWLFANLNQLAEE